MAAPVCGDDGCAAQARGRMTAHRGCALHLEAFAAQTREACAELGVFLGVLRAIAAVPPAERFAAGVAAAAVKELVAALKELQAELARLAGADREN